MNWLNLHHLKYFLIIAEEGSISAASKKLFVGQPALSAQLKLFEEYLGFMLFKRIGKKMQITPEGEYVLRYARAIKQLEDELISNLGHAKESGIKEFTLGAQESVPKTIIALAISAISSIPSLKLKVIEGTGEELFGLLTAGKIDFFLGNFRPMDEAKEMFYSSLAKEKVSIWGSKKFAKLKKNFPNSLSGTRFVLPGFQNPIRHDFEKFMLELGLNFEVSIEAQDTALLKELAVRGEGLIIMGEESASAWVNAGSLIKIGSIPKLTEEYWLGMVRKKLDNEQQKLIIKAIGQS
jgi:LysR family transcriptional regulator, transcriptional activator of nhaA